MKREEVAEPEEEKVGFLNNLTEEEREAMERRNAEIAAREAAKREKKALERAQAEARAKKEALKKTRAWVKGHKAAEANRIYEDEEGWLVCELCTKKFFDFDCIEAHIATDKHKNNMAYYANRPVEPWKAGPPGGFEVGLSDDNLPEFCQWNESEEFYNCTLCNKKAATLQILEVHLGGKEHQKKLDNLQWYAEQAAKRGGGSPDVQNDSSELPACIEWVEKLQIFMCRWCEKQGADEGQIVSHLESKDHSKKCDNLGIPRWGETGHLEAVKQYTKDYGFDIWARDKSWPEFIIDTASCWKCTRCSKGLITRAAVNEHIMEAHGTTKPAASTSLFNAPPPRQRAPVIAQSARPLLKASCGYCDEHFSSEAELRFHEKTEKHLRVVERSKVHTEEPLIQLDL